ncbi:MAG: squalene/phytoene synthase family protein, partial [Hyphomicrobiales bacterium]|nr:squalene/phytoene synthase family protein [Hyphomicrobiales bacterium]
MDSHFQHCADHLRRTDYGRYISCLFLPPELRNVAFVLYAFHVKIREIPALISDPMPGEIRNQWWVDIVTNTATLSGDPLARALQDVIVKYDLPVERIERLLQAHIFDLYSDPVTDRQALETYLGETYSCLFLLLVTVAIKIKGQPSNEVQAAIADACGHGGVFVGTVELLKALPFQEYRKQTCFPKELSSFSKFEEHQGEVDAVSVNDKWLADIEQYAICHYDETMKAIARLPEHARTVFNVMALSRS